MQIWGGPSGPREGLPRSPELSTRPLAGSMQLVPQPGGPPCLPMFGWVSRVPPTHSSVFVESRSQPQPHARVTSAVTLQPNSVLLGVAASQHLRPLESLERFLQPREFSQVCLS